MKCQVQGCDHDAARRGVCWGHYQRYIKYGHPQGRPAKRDQMPYVIDKIGCRTSTSDVGCWVYETTSTQPPRIVVDGRRRYVRDLLYSQYVRPLEQSERLQRRCATANCVNPDHHMVTGSSSVAA